MAFCKAVFLIFLISMLGKQAYNIIWGFRTGADPGFLEMGFICLKVWFALLIYLIFLKISHENEIIWSH